MPLIWCAISGHGYGHAAQVVPVLNELAERANGLRAILRTPVSGSFFQDRLTLPWELSQAEQDIGCVQAGPLRIQIPETWAEHGRFHRDWDTTMEAEAAAIRSVKPTLVLSDISYLAIAAAARAQIPSVALGNLSWDVVLETFHDPAQRDQARILRQIQRAYALADMNLRPRPGIPMKAFRKTVDIGPIHQRTVADPETLRCAIGASSDDTIVLVGFGGIPLPSLPIEDMERMAGFRFIVPGPVPAGCRLVHSDVTIPLPFPAMLPSVDVIMSKPGYSTIVEAVGHQKPVLYVRRYNFADEECLVQYLHRYGRGRELSARDFATGRWQESLQALLRSPPPTEPQPAPTGSVDAAKELLSYL